jgi:hypothetical protein
MQPRNACPESTKPFARTHCFGLLGLTCYHGHQLGPIEFGQRCSNLVSISQKAFRSAATLVLPLRIKLDQFQTPGHSLE